MNSSNHRTLFDLSETGHNTIIHDEVSFQLQRLKQASSLRARKVAVSSMVKLVTTLTFEDVGNLVSKLGVSNILMILSDTLCVESDSEVVCKTLFLIAAILRLKAGAMSPFMIIAAEKLSSVFFGSAAMLDHTSLSRTRMNAVDNISPLAKGLSPSKLPPTGATSTLVSSIHRKRKFTAVPVVEEGGAGKWLSNSVTDMQSASPLRGVAVGRTQNDSASPQRGGYIQVEGKALSSSSSSGGGSEAENMWGSVLSTFSYSTPRKCDNRVKGETNESVVESHDDDDDDDNDGRHNDESLMRLVLLNRYITGLVTSVTVQSVSAGGEMARGDGGDGGDGCSSNTRTAIDQPSFSFSSSQGAKAKQEVAFVEAIDNIEERDDNYYDDDDNGRSTSVKNMLFGSNTSRKTASRSKRHSQSQSQSQSQSNYLWSDETDDSSCRSKSSGAGSSGKSSSKSSSSSSSNTTPTKMHKNNSGASKAAKRSFKKQQGEGSGGDEEEEDDEARILQREKKVEARLNILNTALEDLQTSMRLVQPQNSNSKSRGSSGPEATQQRVGGERDRNRQERSESHLQKLCCMLGTAICRMNDLISEDLNTGSDSGRYGQVSSLRAYIWLLLGVLEAACFHCPGNQIHIASSSGGSVLLSATSKGAAAAVCTTTASVATANKRNFTSKKSNSNSSSNSHANGVSLPAVILSMLKSLLPVVSAGLFEASMSSSQDKPKPSTYTEFKQRKSKSQSFYGVRALSSTSEKEEKEEEGSGGGGGGGREAIAATSSQRSDVSGTERIAPLTGEYDLLKGLFPELPFESLECTSFCTTGPPDISTSSSSSSEGREEVIHSSGGCDIQSPRARSRADTGISVDASKTARETSCHDTIASAKGSSLFQQHQHQQQQQAATAGSLSGKLQVSPAELFTAGLKLLISLTNNCHSVCQLLLQDQQRPFLSALPSSRSSCSSSSSSSSSSSIMQWTVAVVSWCASWRFAQTTGRNDIIIDSHKNDDSKGGSSSSRSRQSGSGGSGGAKRGGGGGMVSELGALSPQETAGERFVFDCLLYVLALQTNIVECTSQTTSLSSSSSSSSSFISNAPPPCCLSSLTISQCLQEYPMIQAALPCSGLAANKDKKNNNNNSSSSSSDTKTSLLAAPVLLEVLCISSSGGNGTDMQERQKQKQQQQCEREYPAHSSSSSPPPPLDSADMVTLLIDLIAHESRDFISDIVATDDLIISAATTATSSTGTSTSTSTGPTAPIRSSDGTVPLSGSAAAASPLGSASASASSSSSSAGGNSSSNSSGSSVGKSTLPVAELIVSAHAALLLFTMSTSSSSSSSLSALSTMTATGTGTDEVPPAAAAAAGRGGTGTVPRAKLGDKKNQPQKMSIVDRLPRGSWWLPRRILQAFLALQGSTGILLYENVSSIVRALRSMESIDSIAAIAKIKSEIPSTGTVSSAAGSAVRLDLYREDGRKGDHVVVGAQDGNGSSSSYSGSVLEDSVHDTENNMTDTRVKAARRDQSEAPQDDDEEKEEEEENNNSKKGVQEEEKKEEELPWWAEGTTTTAVTSTSKLVVKTTQEVSTIAITNTATSTATACATPCAVDAILFATAHKRGTITNSSVHSSGAITRSGEGAHSATTNTGAGAAATTRRYYSYGSGAKANTTNSSSTSIAAESSTSNVLGIDTILATTGTAVAATVAAATPPITTTPTVTVTMNSSISRTTVKEEANVPILRITQQKQQQQPSDKDDHHEEEEEDVPQNNNNNNNKKKKQQRPAIDGISLPISALGGYINRDDNNKKVEEKDKQRYHEEEEEEQEEEDSSGRNNQRITAGVVSNTYRQKDVKSANAIVEKNGNKQHTAHTTANDNVKPTSSSSSSSSFCSSKRTSLRRSMSSTTSSSSSIGTGICSASISRSNEATCCNSNSASSNKDNNTGNCDIGWQQQDEEWFDDASLSYDYRSSSSSSSSSSAVSNEKGSHPKELERTQATGESSSRSFLSARTMVAARTRVEVEGGSVPVRAKQQQSTQLSLPSRAQSCSGLSPLCPQSLSKSKSKLPPTTNTAKFPSPSSSLSQTLSQNSHSKSNYFSSSSSCSSSSCSDAAAGVQQVLVSAAHIKTHINASATGTSLTVPSSAPGKAAVVTGIRKPTLLLVPKRSADATVPPPPTTSTTTNNNNTTTNTNTNASSSMVINSGGSCSSGTFLSGAGGGSSSSKMRASGWLPQANQNLLGTASSSLSFSSPAVTVAASIGLNTVSSLPGRRHTISGTLAGSSSCRKSTVSNNNNNNRSSSSSSIGVRNGMSSMNSMETSNVIAAAIHCGQKKNNTSYHPLSPPPPLPLPPTRHEPQHEQQKTKEKPSSAQRSVLGVRRHSTGNDSGIGSGTGASGIDNAPSAKRHASGKKASSSVAVASTPTATALRTGAAAAARPSPVPQRRPQRTSTSSPLLPAAAAASRTAPAALAPVPAVGGGFRAKRKLGGDRNQRIL